MATPAPKEPVVKHPGERLSDYFDNFFKTIVGVCTLGASITFAKIVQTPVTPWTDYGVSKDTVQNYLAISWLCFILDLVITSFAASALSLYRPQAIKYFGTVDSRERRIVAWYATLVSATLFGLLIAAFIFLCLVVAAYTGSIGWAGVGFCVFFGLLGFGSIVWQSPIGEKAVDESLKSRRRQHQDYGTPEKKVGFGEPRLSWESYQDNNGTTVGRRYVEDRLTTIPPLSAAVPYYTTELRMSRASRNSAAPSYNAVGYEKEPRRPENTDMPIQYDEKAKSISSLETDEYNDDRPYDNQVPAPQEGDRYEGYSRY
ncbi:hypothetical protein BP5796_09388 [Coleophoma crateriformis]|uniref:Uncharacterized protein n=1 Tax=Coleophoma crateriformis TaxID=565419 RepID=A0A3D8QXX8_9HELO|nr:hypothetical protein BP5796_09388 [Coleophoma crateriformis]